MIFDLSVGKIVLSGVVILLGVVAFLWWFFFVRDSQDVNDEDDYPHMPRPGELETPGQRDS